MQYHWNENIIKIYKLYEKRDNVYLIRVLKIKNEMKEEIIYIIVLIKESKLKNNDFIIRVLKKVIIKRKLKKSTYLWFFFRVN